MAGPLESPNAEISRIMPVNLGQGIKHQCNGIVQMDRIVVADLGDGKVWTNFIPLYKYHYPQNMQDKQGVRDVFGALVALGLIPVEVMKAQLSDIEASVVNRPVEDWNRIVSEAENIGMKVSVERFRQRFEKKKKELAYEASKEAKQTEASLI
jgi:hypothetical protein